MSAAYHRARYGYSWWDIAALGFDTTTVPWIGKALVSLADNGCGFPPKYPDRDAWEQDLRFYGYSLQLSRDDALSPPDREWLKAAYPDIWEQEYNELISRGVYYYGVDLEEITEDRVISIVVVRGMHWVADNVHHLWD